MAATGKSATPALDRLAELDQAVADAQQRARSLARDITVAREELERLAAERVQAFSLDDEEAAKRLAAKRTKAQAALTDLDERRQGADLAVRRAQAERDGYVAEHYRQLVVERTPSAKQAVAAIKAAIAALDAGVSAWLAEAQTQAALTRHIPGLDGRAVPDLHITQAVRELAAAADHIELPLPRQMAHGVTIDPPPEGLEELGPGTLVVNDGNSIGVIGSTA